MMQESGKKIKHFIYRRKQKKIRKLNQDLINNKNKNLLAFHILNDQSLEMTSRRNRNYTLKNGYYSTQKVTIYNDYF